MAQTVNIQIPDMIAENYPTLDELQRGLYEDIIISEFQRGNLSIRDCAQLLDLTYEAFIEFLGKRKLSFITASKDELEKSYANFEKFVQAYNQK